MPRVARGRTTRSTRTPTTYNINGHIIESYNHIDDLPILSSHPKKRPRHVTRGAAAAERKAEKKADATNPPPTPHRPCVAATHHVPTLFPFNVSCRVCLKNNTARKIILCSICRKGIHTFCLNPPLIDIPTDAAWKCLKCRIITLPFKKEASLILNDALTTYPSLCTDKYVNAVANAVCIVSHTDCASAAQKKKNQTPNSTSITGTPNDNTVILRFNTPTDTDLDTDEDVRPNQNTNNNQPQPVTEQQQQQQQQQQHPTSPSSSDLDDERPLSELVGRHSRRPPLSNKHDLIHASPKLKHKAQRQRSIRMLQQQSQSPSSSQSNAPTSDNSLQLLDTLTIQPEDNHPHNHQNTPDAEDDLPLAKRASRYREKYLNRINTPPKKAIKMNMNTPPPAAAPIQMQSNFESDSDDRIAPNPIESQPVAHASPQSQQQQTPKVEVDSMPDKKPDSPVLQPEHNLPVLSRIPSANAASSASAEAASKNWVKIPELDAKEEALLTLAFGQIRSKPGDSYGRLSFDGEAGTRTTKTPRRPATMPETERQRMQVTAMAESHNRDRNSLRMQAASSISLPSINPIGSSSSFDKMNTEELPSAHTPMDESRLTSQLSGGVPSLDPERSEILTRPPSNLHAAPRHTNPIPHHIIPDVPMRPTVNVLGKEPIAPLNPTVTNTSSDERVSPAIPFFSAQGPPTGRGQIRLRDQVEPSPMAYEMAVRYKKPRVNKPAMSQVLGSTEMPAARSPQQQFPASLRMPAEISPQIPFERPVMLTNTREPPANAIPPLPRPYMTESSRGLLGIPLSDSPIVPFRPRAVHNSSPLLTPPRTTNPPLYLHNQRGPAPVAVTSPFDQSVNDHELKRQAPAQALRGKPPGSYGWEVPEEHKFSARRMNDFHQQPSGGHDYDYGRLHPLPPPIDRRPKRLMPYVPTATRKAQFEQGRALAFVESGSNALSFDHDTRRSHDIRQRHASNMSIGRAPEAFSRPVDTFSRPADTFSHRSPMHPLSRGRREFALPEELPHTSPRVLFSPDPRARFDPALAPSPHFGSPRYGSEIPQAIREPLRPPTAMASIESSMEPSALGRQRSMAPPMSSLIGTPRNSEFTRHEAPRGIPRPDFGREVRPGLGAIPGNHNARMELHKSTLYPALHPPLSPRMPVSMAPKIGGLMQDLNQRTSGGLSGSEGHRLEGGLNFNDTRVVQAGFTQERDQGVQRQVSNLPLVARFDSNVGNYSGDSSGAGGMDQSATERSFGTTGTGANSLQSHEGNDGRRSTLRHLLS